MSTQITRLGNGLRVVTHTMPHLETVSLGLWVAAGARHEKDHQNGISHLIEHMAFKGTKRRNAQAIAEEIEHVGGELNAATSLESTAYFARVLKGDEPVALDLLADILQNSVYATDELEREREVILQEIAATRDSPDEIAYDLLQEAAFPGQAVGRPILGTAASVGSFAADDLRAFLADQYVARRMVVAAAGAVEHASLVRHVEAQFGSLNGGEGGTPESARYVGGTRTGDKPFEQSHFLIGFTAPSYREKEFYAAQVFSGLFGGGMSSRLFQEIRERRGLCYAIYSSCWALADTGIFNVHAATGPGLMRELIDVIGNEFERAASERPAEAEVHRAKAQLKAGLLMSLESSSARAEQMARQILLFDRLITTPELIDRVESVTAEAIRSCAATIVSKARPSIAIVGAGSRGATYAQQAERLPVVAGAIVAAGA